uniref:C2H2-type domain-containing protein n=1 Tax=Graphocephala atropunctata TaxID=36148 RepID=A0A1B6KAW5_9HEMI
MIVLCQTTFEELYCKACDRGFPTKSRFVFHLNSHKSHLASLRCDQCWAVFGSEDALYDHVRFQHEPDEQMQCEECSKVFKNEVSLSMHMRRHQTTRAHKCTECGKRFQNAQTLREHLVSHMTVKPYQCHICGAYLSRLSRLRIHLRTHSVKSSKASMKAFKCSVCTQLFPNTKVAFKHAESHAEANINLEELEVTLVFRCEYCDASFQQTSELQEHRKKKHANPKAPNAFTCNVCGAQFSTFARVTTHKLTHGITTESLIVPDEVNKGEETFVIPQYFLCHECDKRCLHYTYMNLHRRFHHAAGKPIFPCNLCGEKFATSWSLTFHKKKQHYEGTGKPVSEVVEGEGNRRSINTLYHCSECDKPYMTETSLELHMKKRHQSGQCENLNSNYICETCGKTFHFKTALEAHADAHKGMKRFECEICERRFTHRPGLIRHMKLHSDEDPLMCEFCGKKFRDRTERDNHRRAHTGERPFMCEVCGRTFHTRAVWLDHSRIHEDIRPYQCHICNQSFRRSYALKNHHLIHTGEKPFACEVCGRTFRLRQTLYSHNKKEHQTPPAQAQAVLPDADDDDDGLSEVDSDNLVTKTFMNKSGEIVITEEVLNSTDIGKPADPWKMESKSVLVSKAKTSTTRRTVTQRGYSLLLKSDPISLTGTR